MGGIPGPPGPHVPSGHTLMEIRLSDGHADIVRRFKADLAAGDRASASTEYGRQAHMFLAWVQVEGRQLDALPPTAVELYYQYRGLDHANTARNMCNAALRLFLERWCPTVGIIAGPFDFPPSVRPKPVVRRPKPQQESNLDTVTGSTSDLANGTATPFGAGLQPGTPTGGDNPQPSSQDAGAHMVTPPVAPVAQVPPPVPPGVIPIPQTGTPAVQPVVIQVNPTPNAPTPGPSGAVRPLNMDPLMRKRQQIGSASFLSTLIPENDKIILYRVSDGSDNLAAGKRLQIGEYTEVDLRGHTKIDSFIKETVHPNLLPLQQPVVKYIVEQYDNRGQRKGAPTEVSIQNALGGRAEAPAQRAASFTGLPGGVSTGNPNIDAVVTSFLRRVEHLEQISTEERTRFQKQMDDFSRGAQGSGPVTTNLLLHALLEKNKPASQPVSELMEDFVKRIQAIVSPPLPAFGSGPSMPVLPPPGPTAESKALDRVLDTLDRREAQAHSAPPKDPFEQFMQMLRMQKELAPPVPPAVDPRVAYLEAELNLMRQRQAEVKPVSLIDELHKLKALKEFVSNEEGSGALGGLAALAEKLPETITAMGDLIAKAQAGAVPQIQAANGQRPARPSQAPAKGSRAAPQPQKPPPVPGEVRTALEAMRDAKDENDVLAALRGFILALAKAGGNWTVMLKALQEELVHTVDTVDELQSTIIKTFRMCQARDILLANPGLGHDLAQVIGRNYPQLMVAVGAPEKQLADFQTPAAPAGEEDGEGEDEEVATPVNPGPKVPAGSGEEASTPVKPEASEASANPPTPTPNTREQAVA